MGISMRSITANWGDMGCLTTRLLSRPFNAPGRLNYALDHSTGGSAARVEQGNASCGINSVKCLPIRAFGQTGEGLLFQILCLDLQRIGIDHPDTMQPCDVEQLLIPRKHCSIMQLTRLIGRIGFTHRTIPRIEVSDL